MCTQNLDAFALGEPQCPLPQRACIALEHQRSEPAVKEIHKDDICFLKCESQCINGQSFVNKKVDKRLFVYFSLDM